MAARLSIAGGGVAGSTVLRQCLGYRGVVPILACPDPQDSSQLLKWAIDSAKDLGLVHKGDKIIVSLCPRKEFSKVMEEVGIMTLVEA